MSNLSQILADSNWGQESARINQNFQNINTDLEKVKSSTTKFKGYFTTEESLTDKIASPKIGDTAWVGEPYPGTVYDVQTDGQWHNTGKAPDTGSVELQDYAKKEELTELELLLVCINPTEQYQEGYNDIADSTIWENGLLKSNGIIDSEVSNYYTAEIEYSGTYSSRYSLLYFNAAANLASNYANIAYFKDNTFVKSFIVAGGDRIILIPSGYKVKISTKDKSVLKSSKQKGTTIYPIIQDIRKQTNTNNENISTINNSIYLNGIVIVDKTYYNSSIASNGDVSNVGADKNLSIKVYKVNTGDVYNLLGNWTGYDRALYALYNSSDISAGTMVERGEIINNADAGNPTPINKNIVIPKNATYLAVSIYNFTNGKDSIEVCKKENFIPFVYAKQLAEIYKTYQNSAINVDGTLSQESADKNLSVNVFRVKRNDIISLKGDWVGYDRLIYAFYSSDNISEEALIEKGDKINNTSVDNPTRIDKDITVPLNAQYMAVSVYNFTNGKDLIATYNKKLIRDIVEDNNQKTSNSVFSVTKSGDNISITRAYKKGVDIKVNLAPCGASNLVQLKSVDYIGDSGYSNNFFSDLVGPYVMTADENGNEGGGFTGGWHGYNGDQTGAKTARTESVVVKCENVEINDGTYSCNRVDVIVTNYIQAGNTKQEDGNGREVLKEVVTYSFVDNKINVSVFSTALEAITISKYYGMQIDHYSNNYVFFADDKIYQSPGNVYYNVPNPTRMIQGVNSNGDKIQARLNAIALGNLYYSEKSKYSFCADYGKAYYSLIGGSSYKLAKDESIYWEGSYTFVE